MADYLKIIKAAGRKIGKNTKPIEIKLWCLFFIVWFVMAYAVPEFVGFLRNRGEELSIPAQHLISTSDFILGYMRLPYCVIFCAAYFVAKVFRINSQQ